MAMDRVSFKWRVSDQDIWSKKRTLFTVQNKTWHVTVSAFTGEPYLCLLIRECWHLLWKVGHLISNPFLSNDCFYMPPSAHFLSCQGLRLSSMPFPQRNINFLICFTAALSAPPLLFSDPLGERLLLPKNSYYHLHFSLPRTHHKLPGVVLCWIINLQHSAFVHWHFHFGALSN